MARTLRLTALGFLLAVVVGCATGRAVRSADSAAARGDWDTAVAYYREAVGKQPRRLELKIALERATRMASSEHIRRARELEQQDQLPGAMAEYKLAADLDPTATLAVSKVAELDRRIRAQVEASRPRPRIDALQQQAQQSSPVPRLDPRTAVPAMRMPNPAVRDLLKTISDLTGINITYDQGLDAALSRPYPIDIQETPLEAVLNQVLSANGLTFKVNNPRTIFVYQDVPAKRQQYEATYLQTFYVSHADPTELTSMLTQLLQQGAAVRPVFVVSKSSNTITVRATAPIMEVIDRIIKSNDKPRAEVMVEAEILEVDRTFIRQLGLDLSQFALGFTFSPELSPPTTSGTFPPAVAPPFNLNTISQGVSAADFYLTSPSALIQLLESNQNTRVLARPSMRGTAGQQIRLNLGDLIPIPQTVFQSAAAGGVANIPTTSVNYQSVGVNLLFTPRVTYDDEIILEALTLEKSGLGNSINVAGQQFPTITTRQANSTLRLRDGESNLIAGLLLDDERKTIESLPGLSKLPVLGSIFGNSNRNITQTDIVMIITPRIIRSHDVHAEDLTPMYIGTGQNLGAGNAPTLISPEALAPAGEPMMTPPVPPAMPVPLMPMPVMPPSTPSQAPAPIGTQGELEPVMQAPLPGFGNRNPAPTPSATTAANANASRTAGVVPVQATPARTATGAARSAPAEPVRVILTPPSSGADGTLLAGGGPYTVPITVSGAADLASVSLTITFDPAIVTRPTVTQGSFMRQGGATPTFVPAVDQANGRIDIAFSRPAGEAGASNTGLLGAIAFMGGEIGVTGLNVTGVATSTTGQPIQLDFTPVRLVVR